MAKAIAHDRTWTFLLKDWRQAMPNRVIEPDYRMIHVVAEKRLREKMDEPCPLTPGKIRSETHLALFVPEKVGNQAFTLAQFTALFHDPVFGINTDWKKRQVFDQLQSVGWYLVYIGLVPCSCRKTTEEQCALLPTGYQMAGVLQTALLIRCLARKYHRSLPTNILGRVSEKTNDGARVRIGHASRYYDPKISDTIRSPRTGVFAMLPVI